MNIRLSKVDDDTWRFNEFEVRRLHWEGMGGRLTWGSVEYRIDRSGKEFAKGFESLRDVRDFITTVLDEEGFQYGAAAWEGAQK